MARLPDCGCHIVFFHIHMECIQHNFYMTAAHRLHIGQCLITGVEQISFKPVQAFHPQRNIVCLCNFGHFFHIPNGTIQVARLVNRLRIIRRPIGIKPAAQCMYPHQMQFSQCFRIKPDCILLYLRIRRTQILCRCGAVPRSQQNIFIFRIFPQLQQLCIRRIVCLESATGDFKNIKPQFRHFVNILFIIRRPFFLPVCKINTIFHPVFSFRPWHIFVRFLNDQFIFACLAVFLFSIVKLMISTPISAMPQMESL